MGDQLGDRMKRNYEDPYRFKLPMRMPVVIRLDGKAFHNYTKDLERPFDERLIGMMLATTEYLVKEIEGAVFSYTQSDEISILVHNYKRLTTQAWFDNQVQKMVSISAAMASSYFTLQAIKVLDRQYPALFDSRVFVMPPEEVCNYFVWRQQDATRNSVQMLARSLYSHKDCFAKNCKQLQEMTFQKGHNWNDLPVHQKRGSAVYTVPTVIQRPDTDEGFVVRGRMRVDKEPPIFSTDADFINRHLLKNEE